MKHQTPESIKFKRLSRRLSLPMYQVVGILETLWIATQKNAPRGDIGRFDNEAIAIELGWEGDPDSLIRELVDVGWLDECDDHRLVVHDWEDNAPGWIKRLLKRTSKSFVTTKNSKTVTSDGLESTPNLTKPNLTKPKGGSVEATAPPDDWEFPDGWDSPGLRAALDDFLEMRRDRKKPVRSLRRTSKGFRHFDDAAHLLFAVEHAVANDYQGIKPDYRPDPAKAKPASRLPTDDELRNYSAGHSPSPAARRGS